MKRLVLLLATGFGLGLSPVASGTTGAFLGLPLVIGLWLLLPWWWAQALAALALAALAVPICDVAEKHFGRKDDGRVVADEYLLFPLCMIGLPLDPLLLAVAFVISRVCDIIKPPPARGLQRVKGGLGIVIDDFFASLYALALNWAAWGMMQRWLMVDG
jgi:phosphatidylglycerophosphatase A